MDDLAAELGMEPLELRERNWINHEEFPYTTICGLTYDSGNYEAATARAKELFDYDGLRAEQAERDERGDPVRLGIGISTFTEMCGLAPSRVLGSLAYGAGGWEHASIRMLPTGKVEVVTGSSAHGQGHETAWSQIVSDQLGVPFEDIRVLHGDTQISPKGMDTYGSRSLAVGGLALVQACDKVVDKARVIASAMLEAPPDEVAFANGVFSGRRRASKTIQEIALATFAAHDLPDGVEPSLDSDATYDPDNFSFPHGTHLCATEVDTETGFVKIRSYVAVDDVGVVVNPMIVEGQVHGGLAQGIAQALYEEGVYDDDGNLVTTTLADYLLPSAADLPSYVTDRTESRAANRLGVKGVGEAGTIASTPAVVNAILDALRPLGVKDVMMPCTPERVWRAIEAAATEWRCGMIPASFDYVRPTSLPEAISALADGGEDAKVIAGGQSLLPLLRLRLAYPVAAGRHRRPGRAAGGQRRRGRPGHRGRHHALPGHPRPADRRALRPAGAGHRHGGRPGDPAPGHAGRLPGPRRPGRRPAGRDPRAGRGAARRGRRRAREIPAGRVLRGLPDDGPFAGRDPDRGAGAQARPWLGLSLREVSPNSAGVGHCGRRRAGEALRWPRGRGADRADQHGVGSHPGGGRGVGRRGSGGQRGRTAGGCRQRRRWNAATGRPARRARLPSPPRAGPDRPSTRSGSGSMTYGAKALIHRSGFP